MSERDSNTFNDCIDCWVDTETRYVLRIYRYKNPVTHAPYLCGYVELPKGHNCEGANQMQLQHLHVHGGVTFSELDSPAEPWLRRSWWVGFDCNHYTDTIYPKSHSFVKVELIGLAKQLSQTRPLFDAQKAALVTGWLNEKTA